VDLQILIYQNPCPQEKTQPLSNLHGFGDIKALSSIISPYLMKTNPWFAWDVLFEFDNACKTQNVHVPEVIISRYH